MNRSSFLKPNGAISVKPGDTISAYCARIYGVPASQTQSHWNEFGRERHGGLVPIEDPNRIFSGETIFHLPTAQNGGREVGDRKKNANGPMAVSGPQVAAPKVTNIWMGVGADVQYTLGVVGQQLMIFSLRSYDDPSKWAVLMVENYKFGISIDLVVNGYFVLATGLHYPRELHNQNSSEKLDWDWTLALGLNWGTFIKNGRKSVKAAAPLSNVVREGTRMAKKKISPEVLQRVRQLLLESNKSKKEKLIDSVVKHIKPTPDELASIYKNLNAALKEANDINFESAYPRVHFIPAVGGGVGLGVTKNFGQILFLAGA